MDFRMFLEIAWLLIPAGAANSAPVVLARWQLVPFLAQPLDGGSGVLGAHKTWRGFIGGVGAGVTTALLLHTVVPFGPLATVGTSLVFGFVSSLAALGGDALASLAKRTLGLRPGEALPIVDQSDSVVPALIVVALHLPMSLLDFFIAACVFTTITAVVSFIGVKIKIKEQV